MAYLKQSCEYVKLKHRDVVVTGEVNSWLQSHGLHPFLKRMDTTQLLFKTRPLHYTPVIKRRNTKQYHIKLCHHANTAQTLFLFQFPVLPIRCPLNSHLLPNERLQNSSASVLVTLYASPWKCPSGNMAFSSQSMWLKSKDSLVKFLLGMRRQKQTLSRGHSIMYFAQKCLSFLDKTMQKNCSQIQKGRLCLSYENHLKPR